MSIRLKIWNRLAAPGHDFRCAISKVIPRIDQLVEKKAITSFSLKLLLFFQSFFSFFQLWADARLIKQCYCIFLSYLILQMLVVRKHSTKPFNGTRVEKVWETLVHCND